METRVNPLGEKPIGSLLRKFALPSIVAMLVGALYNIVDQLFIGQRVGELGNAATNIAFPLSISCISIALLFGIGGASAYNLALGEGNNEDAPFYIGNSVTMVVLMGIILTVITEIFLESMLMFFGSPLEVFPYAKEYTRITALGFPLLILQSAGAHFVRADGSPKYSMLCSMAGAVVNTALDAFFVFGLNLGMKGAAWATVIGQVVSSGMVVVYLTRFRTAKLLLSHFCLKGRFVGRSASLGVAPSINQLSMMVVQIVLNNSLKHYGAMSVYGESIPIACAGIVTKVGQLFFSFIIGISQGLQPIVSFNYGAKKFKRVKEATLKALTAGLCLSIISFAIFQIFPLNIIKMFGEGSPEYYDFAVKYFRIYFFFIFINFVQPIVSNFFTATGRPKKGTFLSLTRQILYLLPLLLILPLFFGIDGIIFAGPIADGLAAATTISLGVFELKNEKYKADFSL